MSLPSIRSLIKLYFRLGLQQQEILINLGVMHDIYLSERQLRRLLRILGLFRRKYYTDVDQVLEFLQREIQGSGQLHGYKWMHLKCLQNNITVTQQTVRLLLKYLDPHGVDCRRRRRLRRRRYSNKGPNYLWHMDGYDKLKPYGICISGCIDGFSRHIIWLKAGINTNNPRIISGYYLQAVTLFEGCPQSLRADRGTENGHVEQMQIFLRERSSTRHHFDLPAFLYGSSPANQRIEAWWSILRQHQSQYWINFFQQMKDNNLFDGSIIDKSLVQFCFLKIIQQELDTVVMEWNMHRISPSRNQIACAGRPHMLFNFPEAYNASNYLCEVRTEDLELCAEESIFAEDLTCSDDDVFELAKIIMDEKNLEFGNDIDTAVNLYCNLRTELLDLL